ncbi:GNAT family N-acetyltransferase [Sutcliffiella halmapala]|uniref:GNAT family N-acetyltransferase n=1 Tax=Sutcliffiella halmapala TaxID=79882 RepID=UPI0009956C0E|nr:GNAT family N-acetyltransferase [Sutcliffiella halmapala]
MVKTNSFYEINTHQYGEVLHLIEGLEGIHNVFVYAVIEQKQQGKIFVNNLTSPTAGLVVNKGGCYYVFGEISDTQFNQPLISYLKEQSNHANFFDLYMSSKEWVSILKPALEGNVVELKRNHYILEENRIVHTEKIPDGFVLKNIDEYLFNKYMEQVDHSYSNLWDSAENYLNKAFGICLVNNDEFASVCNTFYIGNGYIAPDIITMDEYRELGLATIVCSTFIRKSRELDLIPYWDCDAGNDASNALAQKLGFTKLGEVPILWWHQNQDVIRNYLKKNNY